MSTFELVGLPGSGKTTICTELLARADDARPSPVAHRLKGLRNSMLVRLFAPIAAVRFRRVLREIARGQGGALSRARCKGRPRSS